MKMIQAISCVRNIVSSAKNGYMHFGARNRIWDAMASDFRESWAYRRASLGHIVACETLPKWNALEGIPPADRRLPQEILNACRERILGELSVETGKRLVEHYDRMIDIFFVGYATADRLEQNGGLWPTHAPYAALKALTGAAWMTLRLGDYETLDDMGPDGDVHFVACCDLVAENAGDVSVAEECRSYWLHWLDDLLPIVLGEYSKVEMSLRAL